VNEAPALAYLRSSAAIRERCGQVFAAGMRGELAHFAIEPARLGEVASYCVQITRERYPDLRVPPHSRFGHFEAGGVQRMAAVDRALAGCDRIERARRLCELVVTSVLLDAGAGPTWRFVEADTGLTLNRSEGLAVASLAWAADGGMASSGEPYRVDAAGLSAIDQAALDAAFQVTPDNPLVGSAGRVHVLRELGRVLSARRDVFGPEARLGGLIDRLVGEAVAGALPATRILETLLDAFSEIWPGRLRLGSAPLGDVWAHAAVGGEGDSRGLVPLHKLSQWLSYSLLHPLEVAGVRVTGLDRLTGLAEYRNGGLFLDMGALVPKHPAVLAEAHAVGSELVVEWRALTVCLLDRLAPLMREELGLTAEELPLSSVLEGGTWAAGRALAQRLRADGSAPLRVVSDGTVF
jgi:hypothetical protein